MTMTSIYRLLDQQATATPQKPRAPRVRRLTAFVALALCAFAAQAIPATYTDDFNRSDSGSLGASWIDASGGWDIVSNTAAPEGGGDNFTIYDASVGNDQRSKVVFSTVADSAQCGPAVRMNGAYTSGYHLYVKMDGSGWSLQVATSYTEIAAGADAFAGGDSAELKAVGTTISVYKNDVLLDDVVDATIASGGVGVISYNEATCRITSWEGGDVSAPPAGLNRGNFLMFGR